MKKYAYNELFKEEPIIVNENEILKIHFDRFNDKLEKLKLNPKLYTEQDCIDDWVTEYWAWEHTD